jgi:hypothetical protein
VRVTGTDLPTVESTEPATQSTEPSQPTTETTTPDNPIKEAAANVMTAGLLQYVAVLFYTFVGVLAGVTFLVFGLLLGLYLFFMKVNASVYCHKDISNCMVSRV